MISPAAMMKKIMQAAPSSKREIHVTFPHVSAEDSMTSDHVIPANLEDIPILKPLANGSKRTSNWHPDNRNITVSLRITGHR